MAQPFSYMSRPQSGTWRGSGNFGMRRTQQGRPDEYKTQVEPAEAAKRQDVSLTGGTIPGATKVATGTVKQQPTTPAPKGPPVQPTYNATAMPTQPDGSAPPIQQPQGQRDPLDWKNGPNAMPSNWRGKGNWDIGKMRQDIANDQAWKRNLPQATRGESIQMAMRTIDPTWTAPSWLNRLMEGEAQSANVPGQAYGLRPEYIDALLRQYKVPANDPNYAKYQQVEKFLRGAANANFRGDSAPAGMLNGWPEWAVRGQSMPVTPNPGDGSGLPTGNPGNMAPYPGVPPVSQYPTPTTQQPTGQMSTQVMPQDWNMAPAPYQWGAMPGYSTQPVQPGQTQTQAPQQQMPADLQRLYDSMYGSQPQSGAPNPLAYSNNPNVQMLSQGVGATSGYPFPWYGGSGSGTSPIPNPQPGGGTTMPTPDQIAPGTAAGDYLKYLYGGVPSYMQDPNWASNPTTRQTAQAWVSTMTPYMQTLQNAYQYSTDMNEAQRRWNAEQDWARQMDSYNASLTGRQQQMAEWQAQEAARQWAQNFGYQQNRDANEMDLARWQTNQQVWGRNVAPNVNYLRTGSGWA